jgi:hypothetical protein
MPQRIKIPPLPAPSGMRAIGHRHWAYAGEVEEYYTPPTKEGKVIAWTNSSRCLKATKSGTR